MAGQLTIDTLSASSGVLATQNGMTGIAKAWVNFNGTVATPTITASFNVGSVTKLGTGYYTVNFTTSMASAAYAVNVTAGTITGDDPSIAVISTSTPQTASSVTVRTAMTVTYTDKPVVCVSVFGS